MRPSAQDKARGGGVFNYIKKEKKRSAGAMKKLIKSCSKRRTRTFHYVLPLALQFAK